MIDWYCNELFGYLSLYNFLWWYTSRICGNEFSSVNLIYFRHLSISLELLIKLVRTFGSMIHSTVAAGPSSVGVDLQMEQRFVCCIILIFIIIITAIAAVVGVWNIHVRCAKYEISSFCFTKLKKKPSFLTDCMVCSYLRAILKFSMV